MSDPKGLVFELPEDLRKEIMQCAVEKQISLDWLINLYRRGFNAKVGASGEFPFGKLGKQDEGELTVAMTVDRQHGVIKMVFGKPVEWLALPAAHARHLAKMLLQYADTLDKSTM